MSPTLDSDTSPHDRSGNLSPDSEHNSPPDRLKPGTALLEVLDGLIGAPTPVPLFAGRVVTAKMDYSGGPGTLQRGRGISGVGAFWVPIPYKQPEWSEDERDQAREDADEWRRLLSQLEPPDKAGWTAGTRATVAQPAPASWPLSAHVYRCTREAFVETWPSTQDLRKVTLRTLATANFLTPDYGDDLETTMGLIADSKVVQQVSTTFHALSAAVRVDLGGMSSAEAAGFNGQSKREFNRRLSEGRACFALLRAWPWRWSGSGGILPSEWWTMATYRDPLVELLRRVARERVAQAHRDKAVLVELGAWPGA